MSALVLSGGAVLSAKQDAALRRPLFIAFIQEKFAALSKLNRQLQEQTIYSEGREREMEILQAAELAAAQAEVDAAKREIEDIREQLTRGQQRTEASVSAEMEDQARVIQAVNNVVEARIMIHTAAAENARQEAKKARDAARMSAERMKDETNAAVIEIKKKNELKIVEYFCDQFRLISTMHAVNANCILPSVQVYFEASLLPTFPARAAHDFRTLLAEQMQPCPPNPFPKKDPRYPLMHLKSRLRSFLETCEFCSKDVIWAVLPNESIEFRRKVIKILGESIHFWDWNLLQPK